MTAESNNIFNWSDLDTPTAKILVPTLVLTLGAKIKSEQDDQNWTSFPTGVSKECKSFGHLSCGVWVITKYFM